MAFKPLKNIPVSNQDLLEYTVANSQTLAIGDAVVASTGANSAFVIGASGTTTTPILGVVVGFSPIQSTTSSTTNTLEKSSMAVASNNQTVAQIKVKVIPAGLVDLWQVDLDAATGTTTGSGGVGSFSMHASLNGQLSEASYVANTSTTKQFVSYGVATNFTPNATSSQIVGHFNQALAF